MVAALNIGSLLKYSRAQGVLLILASHHTSSSGITHVSDSLTGGIESGHIDDRLVVILAMWMDFLAFVYDS